MPLDLESIPTNDDVKKEPSTQAEGIARDSSFQVHLDSDEDPQNIASFRKWSIMVIVGLSGMCGTCLSAISPFTNAQVMAQFGITQTVATLAVTLFGLGLAIGPLVIAPLSEIYGRNIIYRVSFLLLFTFSWPVAFAPNNSVYCLFRFVTGLCASAFFTVSGGTAGDMFSVVEVGNAMALFTVMLITGPVLGPFLGGFINQHLNWRWTYHIMTIWVFVQCILIFSIVPETYAPALLMQKACRLRKSTGNPAYWAAPESTATNPWHAIMVNCLTPFKILALEQMALLLTLWLSFVLGTLYLAIEVFPIIFQRHGFDMEQTGLTFLGIALGQFLAFLSQPLWSSASARSIKQHDGKLPPEFQLYMGQLGGVLIPISLYWLAFTTYARVPWIVPIIASIPFGAGTYFIFMSVFTYLVVAYRPVAASAMSANNVIRSSFAAVFPLFAGAMYGRLGTVGATALLAGLTTVMAPLPFVFHRYGARLRQNSRFTE